MKMNFNKEKLLDSIIIGGIGFVLITTGLYGISKDKANKSKTVDLKSKNKVEEQGEFKSLTDDSIVAPVGYKLENRNGEMVCVREEVTENAKNVTYMAPVGYKLENRNGEMVCVREEVTENAKNVTYMAPAGYTLENHNGKMVCVREVVELYPIEKNGYEAKYGVDFQAVTIGDKLYAKKTVVYYAEPIEVIRDGEAIIVNGSCYSVPEGYSVDAVYDSVTTVVNGKGYYLDGDSLESEMDVYSEPKIVVKEKQKTL